MDMDEKNVPQFVDEHRKSRTRLGIVEDGAFAIIRREVTDKKTIYANGVVTCGLAIRVYTPAKRAFDDLDIVFPEAISFKALLDLAQQCEGGNVRCTEPANSSVHAEYNLADANIADTFSIHLHRGGMWFEGACFNLDSTFFGTAQWKELPSLGGTGALLRVPKLEELFILKIRRCVGSDKVDILTMLLSRRVQFRLCEATLGGTAIERYCAKPFARVEDATGQTLRRMEL